jgi:hypothetical protein
MTMKKQTIRMQRTEDVEFDIINGKTGYWEDDVFIKVSSDEFPVRRLPNPVIREQFASGDKLYQVVNFKRTVKNYAKAYEDKSTVKCAECRHYDFVCKNKDATAMGQSVYMKPVRATTTCGQGERR